MGEKPAYRDRVLAVLWMVALGVISPAASAAEPADPGGYSAALIIVHPAADRTSDPVRAVSDCRRYGVVWTGGTARYRPSRISPRPVRGRWQAAGESRIRCRDGDVFRQARVTERPWVH